MKDNRMKVRVENHRSPRHSGKYELMAEHFGATRKEIFDANYTRQTTVDGGGCHRACSYCF